MNESHPNKGMHRKTPLGVLLFAALCLAAGLPAMLAFPAAPVSAQGTADEVPYWASTAKDKVNMRVGPGREYRINWTYVRKGVPLKVLRLIGGWRLVEDPEGARGWVLAQFLTRDRAGIVKGAPAPMFERKDGSGRLLWRAAPGVIGRIDTCADGWCAFDVDGRKGYVRASSVWGADKP
ncbi:MAG: SH3 domain-containing protein [Novosphingobium sp.]